MPTYDYRCEACEHEFELFQSITAKPVRKCPECGKMKVRRLIGTGAGIIFKGSGFYETDYRSKSYKDAAKADKEAGKKSDTADSGKSNKSESKSGSDSSAKSSAKSSPAKADSGSKA
ncbi:FmdB family zinc ribbon protein [Phycisphaerales bacterium AB-hyl4]|uniref:FmdB family zinc ribbon protein n=1 Tax=Natronomicrosphaera hydrolytica TaxID=3242702 RepID=A0ABV4U6I8_9BACT